MDDAKPKKLLAKLLYGSGLRLTEGLNLRVKDFDFVQIQSRNTKGMECHKPGNQVLAASSA
jgi:integrase